jgi:hypothetical protein
MTIIGAAEGVIMPTIITVHMANTNANSIARHGVCAGTMRNESLVAISASGRRLNRPLKFVSRSRTVLAST